uniref:Atx10homo_assoc domain-containing protein n=1 Tax=Strongyloides stercoralis TaxID=6248 RepID=A0A0K0DYT3_STRER
MSQIDGVLKVFCSEDFAELKKEEINEVNKWICTSNLSDLDYFVGKRRGEVRYFVNSIFNNLVAKHESNLKDDYVYSKLKVIYRIFVNLSARSELFREICLRTLTLIHWSAILQFIDLIPETSYAICSYGKELYKEYLLEKKFSDFIGDLIVICCKTSERHASSSLKAFFWKLLEGCPSFLSESYHSLKKKHFIDLLVIIKELTDINYTTESTHVIIHENNVYFMLALVERWCFDDFKEADDLYFLLILILSLGTVSLHKYGLKDGFFTNKTTLENIKIILTNVLCNEDKTGKVPILSEKFRDLCCKVDEPALLNDLKIGCLKLITNITVDNNENKIYAGICGLLAPVLQCSFNKTTLDNVLGKEWSVICIKTLTENCLENQKILMEIKDKLNNSVLESLKEKTVLV